MRKAYKSIVSLAVVLIAGLNFIVPAFAQDPFTAIAIGGLTGASGAGLFGSMASASGLNVLWGNNDSDQMDALWNVTNPDYVYFHGTKHEATNTGTDIYDYIEVDIGDWLDAQSDFIVKFCQDHQITSDDSGSITNTYIDGLKIDKPSPIAVTNAYCGAFADCTIPTTVGTINESTIGYARLVITCNSITSTTVNATRQVYYKGVLRNQDTTNYSLSSLPVNGLTYLLDQNNKPYIGVWKHISGYSYGLPVLIENDATYSTDSYDWNSGTVNTSVFDGWEKARVKIPNNISGLAPNWTIPEFLGAINTLWEQHQQGQIVIEDTDQPVPPPPVPSTPLGDVPFDDWIDLWGQGINEQLENQTDALDFISSVGEDAVEDLESIDQGIGALEETAESIDTNIGIGNGLLGGIKSGVESAVDFLEGIAEHVEELVEEIVEGTETLIAGILNQIPAVFGVIFGPIKQASSIWHYVVEWIQSITAPMTWIWSMASGTSYYIVLPVYASLAGAVVLAFYKRFGK